jgi:hypothetical protein
MRSIRSRFLLLSILLLISGLLFPLINSAIDINSPIENKQYEITMISPRNFDSCTSITDAPCGLEIESFNQDRMAIQTYLKEEIGSDNINLIKLSHDPIDETLTFIFEEKDTELAEQAIHYYREWYADYSSNLIEQEILILESTIESLDNQIGQEERISALDYIIKNYESEISFIQDRIKVVHTDQTEMKRGILETNSSLQLFIAFPIIIWILILGTKTFFDRSITSRSDLESMKLSLPILDMTELESEEFLDQMNFLSSKPGLTLVGITDDDILQKYKQDSLKLFNDLEGRINFIPLTKDFTNGDSVHVAPVVLQNITTDIELNKAIDLLTLTGNKPSFILFMV